MSRRTSSNIRKLTTDGEGTTIKNKKSVTGGGGIFQSIFQIVKPTLFTIGKFIFIGFLGLFGYILYQKSKSGIHNLINIPTSLLNQTLSYHDHNPHNSLPYLFYCDRERPYSSTKKQPTKDNSIESLLPPLFTNLHLQKYSFVINFAILNCSQIPSLPPLPTTTTTTTTTATSTTTNDSKKGKTIFEKFKLKKEWKPIIWGKSPWNRHYYKNIQANPNHLKDITSMKTFIQNYFAPHAISITSNKQFLKYCQFIAPNHFIYDENDIPPTCILIMKGQRYQNKLHTELEQRLITNYPNVRFGIIDANKLRLNHEDSDVLTPEHFGIKLHAIRNGTHYLDMMNPATWDYMDTFVSHAVSVPISDYNTLQGGGQMSLVKPNAGKGKKPKASEQKKKSKTVKKETEDSEEEEEEVPSTPKKTKSSGKSTPKASTSSQSSQSGERDSMSDGAADEEGLKEKARLEQIERERKIRENMDRQQREHLYDTSEDDEDEMQDNNNNSDEEDSVIEL